MRGEKRARGGRDLVSKRKRERKQRVLKLRERVGKGGE